MTIDEKDFISFITGWYALKTKLHVTFKTAVKLVETTMREQERQDWVIGNIWTGSNFATAFSNELVELIQQRIQPPEMPTDYVILGRLADEVVDYLQDGNLSKKVVYKAIFNWLHNRKINVQKYKNELTHKPSLAIPYSLAQQIKFDLYKIPIE